MWHRELLQKSSSYEISRRAFSIIKSFLKLVVNGQLSEAHEINAVIPQDSPHGSTFFLLYIDDFPKNIFRSLVNMYMDDTSVYMSTSRMTRTWQLISLVT